MSALLPVFGKGGGAVAHPQTQLVRQEFERILLQSRRDIVEDKVQLLRVAEVEYFGQETLLLLRVELAEVRSDISQERILILVRRRPRRQSMYLWCR